MRLYHGTRKGARAADRDLTRLAKRVILGEIDTDEAARIAPAFDPVSCEALVIVYSGRVKGKVAKPRKLRMSPVAKNKSPTGFNWGYAGSGPAALAHSILYDCLGEEVADEHYQDFKLAVIACLDPKKEFLLTEEAIRLWLKNPKGLP